MKYYNYDRVTGALLNADEAQESPEEPGVFLLPAWATWEVPGDYIDGQTQYFLDGKWVSKTITPEEIEVVVAGIELEPKTKVELLRELADKNINIFAKALGFTSMADALTYIGEDTQRGLDAVELRAWRQVVQERLDTVYAWYAAEGHENTPLPTEVQFMNVFETAPFVRKYVKAPEAPLSPGMQELNRVLAAALEATQAVPKEGA